MKLRPYTRRVRNLTLTVEPLFTAGHGAHERVWIARVDIDVPEYATTANVARKHYGRTSATAARAVAFNRGHAMLIHALIAGIGQPALDSTVS